MLSQKSDERMDAWTDKVICKDQRHAYKLTILLLTNIIFLRNTFCFAVIVSFDEVCDAGKKETDAKG